MFRAGFQHHPQQLPQVRPVVPQESVPTALAQPTQGATAHVQQTVVAPAAAATAATGVVATMPPPQRRVVLQNVTASVSMGMRVDCASVANKVKHAEYNPKKLPACVMRIREPKATGLVFASGKVVVTGASGVEAAKQAVKKFVAVVESLGLKPTILNFTVQNMIATVETGFPINLELLAYSQARWCMYEPELFPGVIYQTARKGLVAHVFLSGRVVLTGAKTEDHLNEALPHLLPILEQYKQRERTTNNTGQAMS